MARLVSNIIRMEVTPTGNLHISSSERSFSDLADDSSQISHQPQVENSTLYDKSHHSPIASSISPSRLLGF